MVEKPKVNLDKVAQQRAALRKALEEAGGNSTAVLQDIRAGRKPEEHSLASLPGLKRKITSRIADNLAEVDKSAKTFSLKGKGALTKAKEQLRADKTISERTVLDEDALRREIGPVFDEYMQRERDSYELRDIETSWLRSNTDSARNELQSVMRDMRKQISEQDSKIRKEHPRESRAIDLTTYVDQLKREGHIAQTPYVNQCLTSIGERMRTGKPIFLHGPTGTGKTSLARRAATSYSGHDAEMVYCNPQTRESNIWGKTGIRPAANGAIETVDVFGPLARAMQEGKPVIFDEFTALPKEQMVFIKGVFNAKPGDTVNIVGNGRVTIQSGFQMIFTANLKSEKNPERQELPPEIAREFEQNNLEILYNPPHEAFDIMLARLMQPDGSVQMSWHDLNTTLPKFCEALREIQIAYYDRERPDMARLTGTLEAGGRSPSLKKFVMTQ
ncbi:MAG: AAA family ATPase, partial [Patescibacteria group bacterium]